MRKIAINVCHGGFSLSNEAVVRYNEILGRKVWVMEHDVFNYSTFSLVPPDERIDKDVKGCAPENWNEMTKEEQKAYSKTYREQTFNDRDIERYDPILIQVIEEMGEKANGSCAKLKVVEIPKDVIWEINEYDGWEWVAETHRTWS